MPIGPEPKLIQKFYKFGLENTDWLSINFITCGLETIAPTNPDPEVIELKKIGDNPLYVIHEDVFKNWFTLNYDAVDPENENNKANVACGIDEYDIVNEDGQSIQSDLIRMSRNYNDYIKQDILISLDKQVDAA